MKKCIKKCNREVAKRHDKDKTAYVGSKDKL